MLVVLASLLIPVSVISVWAIRTVTNTDQYVATMAPLARNPVIVDHLATKATDELFSTHIVQNKVTAALPPKAKPIVTPIVNQVHNYVYGLALQVFQSPKFGQLWDTLNRHTHDAVVDILTGKQSPLTKKLEKGGGIVVNVTPALNNLIDKANARGVTLFNPLKPILTKGDSLGVTVVSKAQVSKFSGALQPHRQAEVGHPGRRPRPRRSSASSSRWTTARPCCAWPSGWRSSRLLLLAGLSLGRITFINQAGHTFNRDVAASVWDTMLRFLKTDLRWTLLVAVLVALGAWVAGPARYAVWIRSTCAKGARWVATQAHELTAGAGRAAAGSDRARRSGGWILEHLNGLRILGVAVAGALPRLRREPDRVEPPGHRHRARRVPGPAAAGRRLGPQGGDARRQPPSGIGGRTGRGSHPRSERIGPCGRRAPVTPGAQPPAVAGRFGTPGI